MELDLASRTVRGLSHEQNDDRVLLRGRVLGEGEDGAAADLPLLAAVCDGCGGYRGGGMAAGTALEVLARREEEICRGGEAALSRALTEAEETIWQRKRAYPPFREMCTTVVGAVLTAEETLFFHAGDSRAYRFDGAALHRETVDHSYVQQQVDLGLMTPEEAAVSPRRNVITCCLGAHLRAPQLRALGQPLAVGETLLLCSDGLWEGMEDGQMAQILARPGSLREKAEALVELALEQGSTDDISVLLARRVERGEGGAR